MPSGPSTACRGGSWRDGCNPLIRLVSRVIFAWCSDCIADMTFLEATTEDFCSVFDLKERLVLQAGETIKLAKSSSKGFMQETDLMTYDVIGANGERIGSVEVEDHTAVRGFRRTVHFVQRDLHGKVLIDDSWSG